MTENLLRKETSPYLLQHKDNPVHWQPWSEDALNRARDENKPILLSIGYSACHWCHVMAHESFENPAIASLMNAHFINIKVDREERPDLDNIYQSALNIMGEQGGWPLTIFLNTAARPFWGGTYFPPFSNYGRPGFSDVLQHIANVYAHDNTKIEINVGRITQALKDLQNKHNSITLSKNDMEEAAPYAIKLIDFETGGIRGAPKFPQPTLLKFLWLEYLRTGKEIYRQGVTVTLDNICQGGIYDHIGGGFSRYSIDENWLVPHFEKMLYDNALLIELLCEVNKKTGSGLYKDRIAETIDWMVTDLRIDHEDTFALAAARDADSEGVEGKYYVWSIQEIKHLLGSDTEQFCETYNVSEQGNWETTNILHRTVGEKKQSKKNLAVLKNLREKIFDARLSRVPPQRDEKILTDWNALSISALTRCACNFKESTWLGYAQSIFGFLKTNLLVDQRMHHSWCNQRPAHNATLDDYANMARASLDLYQATTDPDYLHDAINFTDKTKEQFWDNDHGGYYLSSAETSDIFLRNKVIFDNATPSGNGVMLEVLARLFIITGQTHYQEGAYQLIEAISPAEPHGLVNQPSLVIGYEILTTCAQVVIALPDNKNPADHELFQTALQKAPFHYVVSVMHPYQMLHEDHPAFGKHMIEGHSAAYICRNQTCELPITDRDELADVLSSIG